MPGSIVATIGAGTVLSYEDPLNAGTYVALPNALEIGEVGEQGEFSETTPISSVTREYIAGMDTPPDKQMVFNDLPGNAAWVAYLAEVDARNTVSHRVLYTNNHQATYDVVLAGRTNASPEGSTQIKTNIFGKQSGAAVWAVI
ncbi:MAG: hypothetical protein NXH95_13720 [Pseudomonadaceae bacterium]|nr:hypothetical protein [Pseudomonadaceae bacterium]